MALIAAGALPGRALAGFRSTPPMAKFTPMIVAETLTLAVVEILRLFAERGVSKNKLDELHAKLVSAVQTDQRSMESFIRSELTAQIESLRAENHARHERLRRELRRLVVGLGLVTVAAAAGSAALVGWMLRGG